MAKNNSHISILHDDPSFTNFDENLPLSLNDDDLRDWWHHVPGARRFINDAAVAVDKHCAVAAHIPPTDFDGFAFMLEEKIKIRHVSVIVKTFEYAGGADEEDFIAVIAEQIAPNFFRDFTEDSPIIDAVNQKVFDGYVVIVKLKEKYSWLTSAVADFNKISTNSNGSIIFVTSEKNPPPNINRLSDYLTPYDVQFFAINLMDSVRLTSQEKLYTATLAAKLAGQSPLLAKNLARAKLFTDGENFFDSRFEPLGSVKFNLFCLYLNEYADN